MVAWCDADGTDKKVHTRMDYFSVSQLQSVTADGRLQVLEEGLQSAMKRVLSKFSAYTSHLATLSEDRSMKAANRAKLTGYCKKW